MVPFLLDTGLDVEKNTSAISWHRNGILKGKLSIHAIDGSFLYGLFK